MSYKGLIEKYVHKTISDSNPYIGDLKSTPEFHVLTLSNTNDEDTYTYWGIVTGYLNTELVDDKINEIYKPYEAEFLTSTGSLTLEPNAGDKLIFDYGSYIIKGIKQSTGLYTLYLKETK